jgi:hypothetical protein
MRIDSVTKEIDDARYTIESAQPAIREFVTNKDFPLKERFRIWEDYCKKNEEGWIIGSEYGKIAEFIRAYAEDNYYEKNSTIDYECLINSAISEIEEAHSIDADEYDLEELIFPSIDELKELIIETNFGECVIDW